MSEMPAQHLAAPEVGWRTIRHYTYIDRPYSAVWPEVAKSSVHLLGDEAATPGAALSELEVRRVGIPISLNVRLHFGGIVCDEELTRLSLRWQAEHHPALFPVLKGELTLAPLQSGRKHLTQIGLVGHYRPPFGGLGSAVDRLAGEQVAQESVALFVERLAQRLEAMVEPEADKHPPGSDPGWADGDRADNLARIMILVDGLSHRPGGAVAVQRQLTGTPGIRRAVVDPLAGVAEVEYDPDQCNLTRILTELDIDTPIA